jgi:tRNA pseudouridine38-40 synthase
VNRFKLVIEYDGRPFMGWQHQAHGPSVQASLARAVFLTTGAQAEVVGAGRTDSGVHALGQVAHIDLAKDIKPFRLMEALNHHLRPDPIAILMCEQVAPDFHARFAARMRFYEYRITNRRAPLTHTLGLAWRVSAPLDAPAMHSAAQVLVGKHDFTTFRSVHCQSASPVKTLESLAVRRVGADIIVNAQARSFLHHQVRSMVGCLKLVGEGQWQVAQLEAALKAANRAALGYNAPPDGLYFMRVDY